MEAAILRLFELSELWHHLGYEEYEEAIDDMDMEEIVLLLRKEYGQDYDNEIKELS